MCGGGVRRRPVTSAGTSVCAELGLPLDGCLDTLQKRWQAQLLPGCPLVPDSKHVSSRPPAVANVPAPEVRIACAPGANVEMDRPSRGIESVAHLLIVVAHRLRRVLHMAEVVLEVVHAPRRCVQASTDGLRHIWRARAGSAAHYRNRLRPAPRSPSSRDSFRTSAQQCRSRCRT